MNGQRIWISRESQEWRTEAEWKEMFDYMMEHHPEWYGEHWGPVDFMAYFKLSLAEPNIEGQPGYNPDYVLGMRPVRS